MILTYLGLSIATFVVSFILYLPLSLVGQEDNFAIALMCECIVSILVAFPNIILFLFYWEAKQQQSVV